MTKEDGPRGWRPRGGGDGDDGRVTWARVLGVRDFVWRFVWRFVQGQVRGGGRARNGESKHAPPTLMPVASRRLAVGGRRSAVGGRRSAVGGRQSAVGSRRSAVGGRRLMADATAILGRNRASRYAQSPAWGTASPPTPRTSPRPGRRERDNERARAPGRSRRQPLLAGRTR
ncbi:hypothetical protein CF648_30045 [Burkholderia sp. 137]|nr:hypothetical protein CF649_30040 [Burkholderia sp. 136(2017)]PNX33575.1 hypothetical protein CF648_30045 [Burkholderia sp. 137]